MESKINQCREDSNVQTFEISLKEIKALLLDTYEVLIYWLFD
jgi:hypothetical protein